MQGSEISSTPLDKSLLFKKSIYNDATNKPTKILNDKTNIYEVTFKEIPNATRVLAKEAYENPLGTAIHVAETVGSSAVMGAALGYFLPVGGSASLLIGAAMTVPIVITATKDFIQAGTLASKKNANANQIGYNLAKEVVSGGVNLGLSFAGGALGAEGGYQLAKSNGVLGDVAQTSQKFILNSENKALLFAKTDLGMFKGSSITDLGAKDLTDVASTGLASDLTGIESRSILSNLTDGLKDKAGTIGSKTGMLNNFRTRLAQLDGKPKNTNDLTMYFGDSHLHSKYSDGMGLPSEIYAAEQAAGRDFAFVTDHNHILARGGVKAGSVRAVDEAGTPIEAQDPSEYSATFDQAANATVKGKFVGGVGSEAGTIGRPDPELGHVGGGNHMNIYDSPDFLKTLKLPRGKQSSFINSMFTAFKTKFGFMNPNDTQAPEVITFNDNDYKGLVANMKELKVKDSTGQDPIMQFNHPRYKQDYNPLVSNDRQGHDFGGASFNSPKEWLATMDPLVHNIEMIKGDALNPNIEPHVNPYFVSGMDYAGYLNRGFHLSPTYGADTHYDFNANGTPLRIGNPPAATGILAPALDKASILDGMRNRRTIATTDFKNLSGVFTANEGKFLMGDIIDQTSANSLSPSIKIMGNIDPQALYQAKLWYDPKVGSGNLASIIETKSLTGQDLLNNSGQVNFSPVNHILGQKSFVFAEIDRVDPNQLTKSTTDPFASIKTVDAQLWDWKNQTSDYQLGDIYAQGNDPISKLPYVDRLFTAPIWIEPLSGVSHSLALKGITGFGFNQLLQAYN